ncbi:MAG: PHB depolymerase family esterase, partial [Myxococcota bacterium]|nr:PHB depolymerase family esterase [Myxococcota bacterium]
VALHGYGSSAAVIEGYSQLNALADRQQVAVVYPEASRAGSVRCWNVGYCGNDDVDDVGFVRTVVELVQNDQGLGRTYVTGMSNGGDMTYRLVCEAPDLVAAAASVTGCMMNWLAESCSPDPVPSVLHIHGNADRTTLWDGDPDYTGGGYLGTLDSVGVFAALHGADQYEATTVSDAEDGSTYILHHWRTESGAAPVQLVEIDGGRHRWPTNAPRDDFSAAELMWEFFTAMD